MRRHNFILTRFNVQHRELDKLPRDMRDVGLDPAWLKRRTVLFESLCAPSVAGQSCQEFAWLVFVHPDTPEPFLSRIESRVRACGGRPVFSRAADEGDAAQAIGQLPPGDILLTTRLDNDDALGRSFVDRLTSVEAPVLPWAINFLHGCQMDAAGAVRLVRHPRNPFITYAERIDQRDPLTCWGFKHHEIPRNAAIVNVRGGPGWLQVIHDDNIENRQRRGPQIAKETTLKLFSVEPILVKDRSIMRRVAAFVAEGAAIAARRGVWAYQWSHRRASRTQR